MPFRLLAAAVAVLVGAALAADAAQAQVVARADTVALPPGGAVPLPVGVVPGTVRVSVYDGAAFHDLPPTSVAIDAAGRLTLVPPPDSLVVLRVAYRVLAPPAVARLRLPPADSLRAAEAVRRDSGATPDARAPSAGPLPGAAIQTRGSISRGVVAGTARDAAITSGLRLELSGEVAPGVRLRGALTDENTPVLPEGTTTQLSDLDRVFVEVESARVRAQLGDVALALPGTSFAPLARQVQGAVVEARLPAAGALAGGRLVGAASAARGLFRSQEIAAVEGVQGPYRLQGRAGEAFVVVVPGSERVTWDGQTLTRGAAADYVIDYATGEITFTSRRLVTRERRITVDFEYTTGGATRTLAAAGAEVGLWRSPDGTDRASASVRVLREADVASFLSDLGLSPAERDAIAAAGAGQALVPGWERVPFDAASPFVLYARRDTLVGGVARPIFTPATAGAPEVYRVRFTQVAPGAGDYRRAASAQNGLFYEYVGPGGGDAIPFRLLPRPAARSLADARLAVRPAPGVEVFAEGAVSRDDVNTLSALDDATAAAAEAGATVRRDDLLGGTLDARLLVRQRADAFRPLDRIRDVDFARRWNLALVGSGAALDTLGERSAEARIAWTRGTDAGASARAEAEAGALALGGVASRRAGVALALGVPGGLGPAGLPWLDARADLASTTPTAGGGALVGRLGTGTHLRARAQIGRPVGVFAPTLAVERERRDQTSAALDSLAAGLAGALPASFAFTAVRPALALATRGQAAEVGAEWRAEAEPLAPLGALATGPVVDAARVLTVDAAASLRAPGGASLDVRAQARRRAWREPFRLAGREDASSVAVQLVGRAAPLSRAVELSAVYDALTERTPLLQETYVLVGPDLGTHVWRDGGGEPRPGEPDGIAQVDEFFPETTPLEGTYLPTFIPGQELFPTVGVALGLRLALRPGRLVGAASPLAAPLNAVALRTTVDVQEQTRHGDVLAVLALRPSALQRPGETVRGRVRAEQEIELFPDHPGAGARLAAETVASVTELASGGETRLARTLRAEAHGRVGTLSARAEVAAERRQTVAEAFATRTFDLRGLRAEPRLTWTPSTRFAASAGAVVADRRDALSGDDAGALVVRLPVDARWALSRRLAVTARAERSSVRLRGTLSGLALFEFTEGRGAGTSHLWGVDVQGVLTERFRVALVYDGRAPASAPVVQTVRATVSAVF